MSTRIEWCDETINPIVGCTKISEGCRNCYAEKMAYRLKCMGVLKYQDVVDKSGWTGKIGIDMLAFNKLPKRKSKKVFMCSMSDLFHPNLSNGDRAWVFYNMMEYPQHIFMLLTKRPYKMKYFLEHKISPRRLKSIKNLWFGVTAENQKRADKRIPCLLQIPAIVRFVSVEPVLEIVDIVKYLDNPKSGRHWPHYECRLDWVIAGPETGPKARPCKPEWIESLYEQCRATNVPFFDKRPNYLAREFPR